MMSSSSSHHLCRVVQLSGGLNSTIRGRATTGHADREINKNSTQNACMMSPLHLTMSASSSSEAVVLTAPSRAEQQLAVQIVRSTRTVHVQHVCNDVTPFISPCLPRRLAKRRRRSPRGRGRTGRRSAWTGRGRCDLAVSAAETLGCESPAQRNPGVRSSCLRTGCCCRPGLKEKKERKHTEG